VAKRKVLCPTSSLFKRTVSGFLVGHLFERTAFGKLILTHIFWPKTSAFLKINFQMKSKRFKFQTSKVRESSFNRKKVLNKKKRKNVKKSPRGLLGWFFLEGKWDTFNSPYLPLPNCYLNPTYLT
jgi:hypothetical protein